MVNLSLLGVASRSKIRPLLSVVNSTWSFRMASPKMLSLLELQRVSTVESGKISIKAPFPDPNCSVAIGKFCGFKRLKRGVFEFGGGVCPLAPDSELADAVTVIVVTPLPEPLPGGARSRSGEPLLPAPPKVAAKIQIGRAHV